MNQVSDPKVVCMCSKLNVCDPSSFSKLSCYTRVVELLQTFSPSTAEDYIWRLCRCLESQPRFPPNMLAKYHLLLTHYKKLYR